MKNKSIEINQKRFGYSDELKAIFINTVKSFASRWLNGIWHMLKLKD